MSIAKAITSGKLKEAKSMIRNDLFSKAKYVIEQSREEIMTESRLDEMAMDSLLHPTHGKLTWENNSGVHQITKQGKVVFSGSHEEVAKRWGAIKKNMNESVEFDLDNMLVD